MGRSEEYSEPQVIIPWGSDVGKFTPANPFQWFIMDSACAGHQCFKFLTTKEKTLEKHPQIKIYLVNRGKGLGFKNQHASSNLIPQAGNNGMKRVYKC